MKLINSLKVFILTLFCLGLSLNISADCEIYTFSSANNPVQFVDIDITNLTDGTSISTNNLTNISGGFRRFGGCENISISATYPSANYSAVLSNASVDSKIHINDFITGRVQLKNTLGSFLEAQDCSVVVYKANTTDLIHDYNTLCKADEPYIDSSGNWVAVSDCKFTDSRGWYYFKGRTDESMGYEYNRWYDLIFTCNGKTTTVTFQTELERQPDIDKMEDFVQKNSGILLIYGFLGFFGILLLLVAIVIAYKTAKSTT